MPAAARAPRGGDPADTATDDFSRQAARFWIAAARGLPQSLSWLAAVSPVASRVPDTRIVFNPGYRAGHRGRLATQLAWEATRAAGVGLAKLVAGRLSFDHAVFGCAGETLLVVPATLGRVGDDGSFSTPYIDAAPEDTVFVFGPPGSAGPGAAHCRVSRAAALRHGSALALRGLAGFRAADGPRPDRFLLLMEWLIWAIALRWLHAFCLERALSERLQAWPARVAKLGCIHEMNSVARTVWYVADARGLAKHTVQHAGIASGKLWYFPLAEEVQTGLGVPDVMHVYSPRVIELLAPHHPRASFFLGCGKRYEQWRDVRPAPQAEIDARRARRPCLLFVTSLASYDNEAVLEAVRGLAASDSVAGRAGGSADAGVAVRVRLHPHAEVPRRLSAWLGRAGRSGAVEVSAGTPLSEDLAQATVVAGMSSTVLEEALLAGKPVIELADPDFLRYVDLGGIDGVLSVPRRELTWEHFEAARGLTVDPGPLRDSLGLAHPVVDYRRLFEADGS